MSIEKKKKEKGFLLPEFWEVLSSGVGLGVYFESLCSARVIGVFSRGEDSASVQE